MTTTTSPSQTNSSDKQMFKLQRPAHLQVVISVILHLLLLALPAQGAEAG